MISTRWKPDANTAQAWLYAAVLLAALVLSGWALTRLLILLLHPVPATDPDSARVAAAPVLRWTWFQDADPRPADQRYQEFDQDTQLLGVLISADERLAVIGAIDGNSRVLRSGDALRDGVRVLQIEPRRVVLQVGASQRQLTLRRLGDAADSVAATVHSVAPGAASTVGSDAQSWLERNIVEHVHAGEAMPALALGSVARPLLGMLGLQPDQLIIAIDGSAVSAGSFSAALQRASDQPGTVALTVLRGEEESTIEVEARALGDMLSSRADAP